MIKKFIFPLIAMILLSSCGSKFSLQKRKYTKGYYLAGSHHHPAKKSASLGSSGLNSETGSGLSLPAEPVHEEIVSAMPEASPSENVKPVEPSSKRYNSSHVSPALASADHKVLINEEKAFKALERIPMRTQAAKGEGGLMLVLLIILCFFPILSLIAVYIHDGGITLNFWITLLLHFILLYWLFALLVVLDVIDLG
jgi:hypothetical protein